MDTKKAAPQDDIPVKMLKYADITLVYKKIIDTKKRIIDLLVLNQLYLKYSNVVFMIKSINKSVDNTLSRHQMCYQKGYSSQYSLIAMFEKWKENLDKGSGGDVVLYLWIYLKHFVVCSMIYY